MKIYITPTFPLFALCLFNFIKKSHQTITGLTYMDEYEFDHKYKDINKCNPLYWHPLHMPAHCLEMYTTLLRSGISSSVPLRVVQDYKHASSDEFRLLEPSYNYNYQNPYENAYIYKERRLTAFEKMFELLKDDIARNPTAPMMGNIPNIGSVAIYYQPVSKQSKNIIKQIAGAYASPRTPPAQYEKYYGKINIYTESYSEDTTSTQTPPTLSENIKDNEKGFDWKIHR